MWRIVFLAGVLSMLSMVRAMEEMPTSESGTNENFDFMQDKIANKTVFYSKQEFDKTY